LDERPDGTAPVPLLDGGNWTENVYDAGVESRDSVTD